MYNPALALPFKTEGEKIVLTAPVFLSCGCGNVNARWATIRQNLATHIPQGKPKSSKTIKEWIEQEGIDWEILKKHSYGIVVAHTDKGYEYVDIMPNTTTKTVENIANLIKRSVPCNQSSAN